MTYAITVEMKDLIDGLHRLAREIERRESFMSTAAQEEWRRMRSRIPTTAYVGPGVAALSEEELSEMKAKISRLDQLLRTFDQRDRERAPI
jgi:hypothetical protein